MGRTARPCYCAASQQQRGANGPQTRTSAFTAVDLPTVQENEHPNPHGLQQLLRAEV